MPAYPERLWQGVADLSGVVLSEESLETTIKRVADLAVRCLPACDAVGVTLLTDGVPSTRAATGGLAYEVDTYQYDIGEGPCLEGVRDHEIHAVEEMTGSEHWPRFCQHASERGIHSSLSLPLVVRGEALGALNLYSRTPAAFDHGDRETALMFAAQAAVALANAQTYAASVRLIEQLREALGSRAVIDQAIGVVMADEHCADEEAFDRLRIRSQQANKKLRIVAEEVVRAAQRDRSGANRSGADESRHRQDPPYAADSRALLARGHCPDLATPILGTTQPVTDEERSVDC